jgi:hypothetical protein
VTGAEPGWAVGEEDRVELGGLRPAGDVLVPPDVADPLGSAVGMAPRASWWPVSWRKALRLS